MALLTIIIAIFLDRVWDGARGIREYVLPFNVLTDMSWVKNLVQKESTFGVIFAVLPLLLVVLLFQIWLDSFLWDIPGLIFSIVIVLYCLGINDLMQTIERYKEVAQEEDEDKARELATEFLGMDAPEDADERGHVLVFAVLVNANKAVFAVLFWYFLLGPIGAVLYRSMTLLGKQTNDLDEGVVTSVHRLHAILNWLPARVLAFTYALSGNFDLSYKAWKASDDNDEDHTDTLSERLLIDVGSGALGLDPERAPESSWQDLLQSAMDLVMRSLLMWVVILSIVTIAGWVS